ncbi:uncharacterized protein LOC127882473 isoform X2 [Dreissena polymorpha]|nr:uncharacterized protein LOC127882473 isoform X2 [Dreissena polymorpha]XP_052287098.1 uncharacterized protein LOC127882473 isoform X2 [Dreissena polymorpha]XP_052287099.1 uncharacterized protein LOC127882473 isoform X2 [Dreissena polymorpha]
MEIFIREMDNNSCERDISLSDERRVRGGASFEGPVIDLNRTRRPQIRIYMDEPLDRAISDGRVNDVQETVDPTVAQLKCLLQMKIKMVVKSSDIRPSAPTDYLRDSRDDTTKKTLHYVDDISSTLPLANIVESDIEQTDHEENKDLMQPALPLEPIQAIDPLRSENESTLESIGVELSATDVVSDVDLATTGAAPRTDTNDVMMTRGQENKANDMTSENHLDMAETNELSMEESTRTSRRGVPSGVNWRIQQPVNTVDVDENIQLKTRSDTHIAKKENEGSDPSVKNLNVKIYHDTAENDEG